MGHLEQTHQLISYFFPFHGLQNTRGKNMIESFMTIWTPSVSSNSVLKRLFPFMRSLSFYINLINTTYCFWNSLCLVLRCISLSFLSENLEEIKFFY